MADINLLALPVCSDTRPQWNSLSQLLASRGLYLSPAPANLPVNQLSLKQIHGNNVWDDTA